MTFLTKSNTNYLIAREILWYVCLERIGMCSRNLMCTRNLTLGYKSPAEYETIDLAKPSVH